MNPAPPVTSSFIGASGEHDRTAAWVCHTLGTGRGDARLLPGAVPPWPPAGQAGPSRCRSARHVRTTHTACIRAPSPGVDSFARFSTTRPGEVPMGAEEIGAVLRGARCAARLTQAEVGKACGYSASAVSRIESGKLHVDYPTLLRFAVFLRIPPHQLRASAVPSMSNIATVAEGCQPDEEDAVRRRELLTGVVAAGATAFVGAGPAAATASPIWTWPCSGCRRRRRCHFLGWSRRSLPRAGITAPPSTHASGRHCLR
ncbi:helix-turn-helix transcriptional regulator [Streptomyces sp. NPDC048191]|uniref:helix-turn-helix domain-containing protein n=1 Tax=Streptomyces sp. NPDC048191 TaxID=3155484 RepID=UPI00340D7E74